MPKKVHKNNKFQKNNSVNADSAFTLITVELDFLSKSIVNVYTSCP